MADVSLLRSRERIVLVAIVALPLALIVSTVSIALAILEFFQDLDLLLWWARSFGWY